MATANVVGSWYPTGFYGHFRSKSRNDFMCEYRHLAKPQPPDKFVKRAKQPISRHVFSHHDNKNSFMKDALIFQQGLGRKRITNSTLDFKPDFITWMPEKEMTERSRPLLSTYKVNYRSVANPSDPVPQFLIKRPKTSFDGVPTTSYRYAHGDGHPNKQMINALNNKALMLSYRKERTMSAHPSRRETVASCLNWYKPHPPMESSQESKTIEVSEPEQQQTVEVVPVPIAIADAE